MRHLPLNQMSALTALADVLYNFLPGTPHPRADQRISFPGAAIEAGVGEFWNGGSKRPALSQLLRLTLEQRRDAFCNLIIAIVRNSQLYRSTKKNSITRSEIESVNNLLKVFEFKIPELWDKSFLESLSSDSKNATTEQGSPTSSKLEAFCSDFLELTKMEPRKRGFAFEKILNEIFFAFELSPRSSFRLTGEQIDGSFEINNNTYLVEAKWTSSPIGFGELMGFSGKVAGKAQWSRGMVISYCGYSVEGLVAFSQGRSSNIICMDGADLFHVLKGEIDLKVLIELKARRAGETGRAFIPTRDLFLNVS